jgi:hypothetical protein
MLIEREQVLDSGAHRAEAGGTTERRPTTMDPAAIGTALIGLDAIRHQSDQITTPATRRVARRATSLASLRLVIAGALRSIADSLEPRAPDAAHNT